MTGDQQKIYWDPQGQFAPPPSRRPCLLGLKPRARSANGLRPNKTRPASLLNGFKHDYKFNRYTALLIYSLYKGRDYNRYCLISILSKEY